MSPPKQAKLTVSGKDFIIELMRYQKEIAGYESLIKRVDDRIAKLKRAGMDVETLLRLVNALNKHLNDYKECSKMFENASRLYEQPVRFHGGVELEFKNKDFINGDTIDKFIPQLNKAIAKRREQLLEEEKKSFKESKKEKQNMTKANWTKLKEKHKKNLELIEDHQQYQLADNVVGSGKNKKSTQKNQSSSVKNSNTYATELSVAIKAFHLQLSLLIIQFNLLDLNELEDKRTDLKVLISDVITHLRVEVPQAEQEMLAEDLQSNEAMTLLFNDDAEERKSRVSLALQNHLSILEIGMLFEMDFSEEDINVVNAGQQEPQAESSRTPSISTSSHSIFSSSTDPAASSSSSFDQGRAAVSHLPKQALGGSQKLRIFKRGETGEHTKAAKSPEKNSDESATPTESEKSPGPGKKPG